MRITSQELEKIKIYTETIELSSVEGVLKLKHEPIEIFPYLLNKYRDLHDVQIDFTSQGVRHNNHGRLSVYEKNYATTAGSVLVNDNEVKFLVDGFTFKNDEFSKHVLETRKIKQHTKDFSILLNYDRFGKYRLRCGIDSETVLMRLLNKPLGEAKFNFPYFNYEECHIIKNNAHYYQTTSNTKNEEINNYRSLYVHKVHELMSKCNFNQNSLISIKTIINLESADILFDTNFVLGAANQRQLLEYVFNHYDELNTPLYSSIIKKSEQFTSKKFEMDIVFNNRDVIKSFLDLTDMAAI
jgi:hypothetical protein